MKITVILDPSIAYPSPHIEAEWSRLLNWVSDDRSRLGFRAWTLLAEDFAGNGITPPQAFAQLAYRAIGVLLARPPAPHSVVGRTDDFAPTYLGATLHRDLLVDDLTGACADDKDVALGTEQSNWSEAASVISLTTHNVQVIAHYAPNTPTAQDRLDALTAWFHSKRIVIVGGQVDPHVITALKDQLGIDEGAVRWIPSEHNKKAQNLGAVIKGLTADDIAICITGKVGHDVSGQMEANCKKYNVPLVESRFASQIVVDLESLTSS